jgi:hypothetical protein
MPEETGGRQMRKREEAEEEIAGNFVRFYLEGFYLFTSFLFAGSFRTLCFDIFFVI